VDIIQRMEKLYGHLRAEIEIGLTEERIKGRVKKQMEKTQRDYYLTEQMRAIQKEMGERRFKSELEELEKRIKRKRLSQEAAAKVRAEFKKLKLMSPMSAEATVVRNYIDWILSLPWYEKTKDKIDIDAASVVLEEDHYGLENPRKESSNTSRCRPWSRRSKGPSFVSSALPVSGRPPLPGRSLAP